MIERKETNKSKAKLLRWGLQPQATSSMSQSMQGGQGLEGQALVEFALVLPILMLIIVGIMEFGLAFFDAGKVDFSSREVARGVAVCSNACDQSEQTITGSNTIFQYDVGDLSKVANSGYVNAPSPSPTLIDPSMVSYIWIQRVYDTGYAIPVTGTQTGGYTYCGSCTPNTDYRKYFNYFVYDPSWASKNESVPFISDGTGGSQPYIKGPGDVGNGGCNSDPWKSIAASEYSNISGAPDYSLASASSCINWPSNPGSVAGRKICEPTDRFFVEIGYKHYWITPLIPSNGGYIILKSRTYMKIEPQYFNNQGSAASQSSCA